MSSADLSTLINSDRVRSSIRRMFTGAIDEILGELFQNSQRARATTVTLTTSETGFAYEDNGHGLLGGVAGFHTLLKIAESHFDNSTLEAQDPMGLGMHALLAHEQVTQVRFESGLLGLTIDCARWWSDQAYYSSWFERLEPLSEQVRGLRIVVACHPEVCERLHGILAPHQANSPALGYADLLHISLDGQMVKTALPSWITRGAVLIETLYQGCPLTVRFAQPHRNDSAVNWYGQLIKDQFSDSFTYYLHVRDGRPVHPLSPSRRGLIDDAARAALIAFIKEHLFAFLFDPANRGMIRAEWVSAYYRLDQERALHEAPYFVAAPLQSGPLGSVNDLHQHGEPCILTYSADHPLLLAQPVITLVPSTDTDQQEGTDEPQMVCYEYGRDTFVPMLEVAYTLICGNLERLSIATLWWKVGPEREDTMFLAPPACEIFYQPGSWGLGTSDAEPECWQPVTTTTVFVFNEPSSWDVDQVDFMVGTNDPLAFYQEAAWAGFDSENDDYDYHDIHESYTESCAAHIRTLIGDAIPCSFTLADIQNKMQDKRSRILSVHYHYPPRQKDCASPIAITARNRAGQRKRLKLVS